MDEHIKSAEDLPDLPEPGETDPAEDGEEIQPAPANSDKSSRQVSEEEYSAGPDEEPAKGKAASTANKPKTATGNTPKVVVGSIVHHKLYGDGNVISFYPGVVVVNFDGQLKKFQFPEAFEQFLTLIKK